MKRIAHLLLSIVVTSGLAACSGTESDETLREVAQGNPPAPNPYDGTPAYTNAIGRDGGQGVISAQVRFSETHIQVVTRPHPTLPKVRTTLQTDLVGPQSVRTGVTTQGAAFLIAVGVDFANNVSRIQTFVDVNGDRLPDATTKTTIATMTGAHFVHTSFDRTLNRLYVLDALNRQVMVVLDNDGDGMPETLQTAAFVPASLLPTGYNPWSVEALASGVRLRHYRETRGLDAPYHYVDCVDGDGNLVAETITERSDDPLLPDGSFAYFDPPIYESDTTATVRARSGRSYRIEAETPSGPEELATFTATNALTTVNLTRAAGPSESILLIEDASDTIIGGMTTIAVGTTLVLRIEVLDANGNKVFAKIAREGNNVRFVGRKMNSGLTVEVRPVADTSWTSCQEASSSTTALEVTVPDLTDATAEVAISCEFRVLQNGTAIAHFPKLVME